MALSYAVSLFKYHSLVCQFNMNLELEFIGFSIYYFRSTQADMQPFSLAASVLNEIAPLSSVPIVMVPYYGHWGA